MVAKQSLHRSFERAQLYEAFKKLDVFKQNCLTRESLQAVLKSAVRALGLAITILK